MELRTRIYLSLRKLVSLFSGRGLGKIYPINILWPKLYALLFVSGFKNRSSVVKIDGHTMHLDARDSLGLSRYGTYEPFETEFFKKTLKPGDLFIDVGANIGYYTLIAAQIVGPLGEVVAFEPDPENFALLEKNIKANSYVNVTAVRKAVSDRSGALTLYRSPGNVGDHRIYDSSDNRDSLPIESVRLDEYFKDFNGKNVVVKMDIQGAEGSAIKGMERLLRGGSITLVTEFWPFGLKKAGTNPRDFIDGMKRAGFELHNLDEWKMKIEPANAEQLLAKYTVESKNYTNLLWIRQNGKAP